MNAQELLAKKIINFREAKDMSQAELAKRSGIERTALNKIEKGTRKVSSDELKAIALALGQSADVLLDLNKGNAGAASKDTSGSSDLDDMLDHAESYDGKPMTQHDREIIRAYLEGHFGK